MTVEKKSKLSNPLLATLLAMFCTLLWGSAYPAIKVGYELFSVGVDDTAGKIAFAGVRFALSGLIVLFVRWVSQYFSKEKEADNRSQQHIKTLTAKEWGQILMLGFVQTTIHYYFFYVGVSYSTGAKSSILNSTSVFFSAIIAHIFYANDKLTLRKGVGVLIGFMGIILVNLESNFEFSFLFKGDGFIIIAALLISGSYVYAKRMSKTISPVLLTGLQLLFGGTLLFLISVLMGATFPRGGFTAYVLLTYMALLSAVAFSLWTSLLKHNPVSSITIYNFLIPVFGTLLSALILKESVFKWQYYIALPTVAVGIYLVNSRSKRKG